MTDLKGPVVDYLKWVFSHHYRRHPDLQRLGDVFLDVRDILIEDICARQRHSIEELRNSARLVQALELEATFEAVLYYRLERRLFVESSSDALIPYLANIMRTRTGMEVYYSTDIGPRFVIMHGGGVVIGPRFHIGHDFTIYQGVTLGQKQSHKPEDTITIGNCVSVFAGAKVLGNLRIGDNVQIGANAVLLQDAESNSVYAGVPARRIRTLAPVETAAT
jgi:serine O-acetyltransferase